MIYILMREISELLDSDELDNLLTEDAFERARIITSKLQYYFVLVNGNLYVLNDNISYTVLNNKIEIDNKLLVEINRYLKMSYESLDDKDRTILELKHKKLKTLLENGIIKNILPQIKNNIMEQSENITFDDYKCYIHFKNGKLRLKDGGFFKRTIGKDFVTFYINRDYKVPDEKSVNKILKILSKIYPKKDVLDYMLLVLGGAMTGEFTRENMVLFLIGVGSTGKSTILKLMKLAFEKYVLEMSQKSFEMGNANINKIMNTYDSKPYIRISWIDEMSTRKIDDSLFKLFPAGIVSTTKLFTEGNHEVFHNSLLINTSNNLPNIKIDTGVMRRINVYQHTSKFVVNKNEVDKSKNVYLLNMNLLEELTEDDLNAIVYIISCNSKEYLSGAKLIKPDDFKIATEETIIMNDIFQEFIDRHVTRCDAPNSFINKNQLFDKFKAMFPSKLTPINDFVQMMKDRGLVYESQLTYKSVKGRFAGVRFRDEIDIEDEVSEIKDNEIVRLNNVISELNKKNEELIKENVRLKNLVEQYENKNKKTVKFVDNISEFLS